MHLQPLLSIDEIGHRIVALPLLERPSAACKDCVCSRTLGGHAQRRVLVFRPGPGLGNFPEFCAHCACVQPSSPCLHRRTVRSQLACEHYRSKAIEFNFMQGRGGFALAMQTARGFRNLSEALSGRRRLVLPVGTVAAVAGALTGRSFSIRPPQQETGAGWMPQATATQSHAKLQLRRHNETMRHKRKTQTTYWRKNWMARSSFNEHSSSSLATAMHMLAYPPSPFPRGRQLHRGVTSACFTGEKES